MRKQQLEQIGDFWNDYVKGMETRPSKTRWWEFPSIRSHINKMVSGEQVGDEFSQGLHTQLKKLNRTFNHGVSVGCGTGRKEFDLIQEGIVKKFTLFELSSERIGKAEAIAKNLGISSSVEIILGNCFEHSFVEEIDFVHWNNALHHMMNTNQAVKWSYDILSTDGVFYMDDYVGPDRFQFSDALLELGTRIRHILPEIYLKNPHQHQKLLPKNLVRPNPDMIKDISEAADSSNIIASIREYFPDAKITLTGGAVYFTTLDYMLYNFDETDQKDKAILDLLLLIDELSLFAGIESEYATALAIKTINE